MDVSVLIPTFRRREILRRVLLLYNRQIGMAGRFEIVVVDDDASTDGTASMLDALRAELTYPVRYFSMPRNSGIPAARNLAMQEAGGRVLFISGDDILPDERLLLEHWTWHTERYPARHVGVLGLVRWADELELTPFMRWLERDGTQFAYGSIRHGDTVGHGFLYTSNVSVKREFLLAAGERFDERLSHCEDTEWGLRLFRKGFELRYNANALGRHLHRTTLESSLKRMESVGAGAAVLRRINPDEFARVTAGNFDPRNRRKLFILRVALHPALGRLFYAPLVRLCERRFMANRLFAACHASYFLKGLAAAGGDRPAAPSMGADRTGRSFSRTEIL